MKVEEALKNVDIVIAGTAMNRNEHAALQQSIMLIAQRCKRADELERETPAIVVPMPKKLAKKAKKEGTE